MKILVYEHITGGGLAGGSIQPSILSEGYAMLKALILDLKAVGYYVITFVDSRLKEFNPPIEADDVISISSDSDLYRCLRRFSQIVDGVYVIAPESGHILQDLIESVKVFGGVSLNCQVDAIERSSNKMEVYEALDHIGLQVPETVLINIHEDIREIRSVVGELGFPLIFKPVVGVGSCGLSVLNDESQIVMAVDKIRRNPHIESFIIQRFVKGVAVSVSLLSNGDETLPLTLNRQIVTLAPPSSDSSYDGGMVPFHHPLEKEALRSAQITAKSLGVSGYVGVDMILTKGAPVIVDVNPRLTTSYIGLRMVLNFNPAQAMIDAILEHKLPRDVHTSGYAFFLKVNVPTPTLETLQKIYRLNEVFSPPFPVKGCEKSHALIVSHHAKVREAERKTHKFKRRLLTILSERS